MASILPYSDARGTRDPELPPPSYGDPKLCTDDHKAKLRAWQDTRIYYTHEYRIRQHRTWRKSDLFDACVQWLIDSYNADPTRTCHWAPMVFERRDPNWIPTPVYNRFSAPIENESARLGKPEYKPYVRPAGEKPDITTRTAAKTAEKVLQQGLDDNRWNEQADMGELHMPLYGGWFLKSWWDVSWEKTTRIPVLTAKKCPGCDFKLAAPDLTGAQGVPEMALQKPDLIQRQDQGDPMSTERTTSYSTDVCLTCDTHEGMVPETVPVVDEMTGAPVLGPDGVPAVETREVPGQVPGPPALEPFTPVGPELQQQDHFGRDLGQDVQLGEWKVRTVSPYNLFIYNHGIDCSSPADVQEWTEVHVESLEWICNRYENGHLVEPENNEAIMQWHPIGGEKAIYYGDGGSGNSVFTNHCRVKETHKQPWRVKVLDAEGKPVREKDGKPKYKTNRGRTLIMAGNIVLLDGDFMVESKVNKGVLIPRVHLDYAPWKFRSGGRELHGVSMSEGLFDVQENINEIKSQTKDARLSEGSFKWLSPRGADLDYEAEGSSGAQWVYDPLELQGVMAKPERIESKLINQEIYTELESDETFIDYHANLNEVESGNVPANVAAALALQILAEQSGERRRPRIRRIREMLMRVFKHGLQLMHEMVREPRLYFDSDETDEWKSWTGMALMGQSDVRIEAEPEYDTAVQEQQNIRDGYGMGLINVQNKRTARITAKKLRLPADLYEEDNLQEEAAQREYSAWMDEGKEPVVDMDLDQDQAHFDQHGIDCHGEKWRQLEEQAGWDKALVFLSDWEKLFDQQQQPSMDAMGQPLMDPMTGQPIMGVVPGLDGQMGDQWPPLLELRINLAWQYILQTNQYQPAPNEVEPLRKVMRFRAHMSAHKRRIAAAAMATQQGQQVVAAPDQPAAADGTVPEAGAAQVVQ